jgi:ADP-heptose:LPS heptosyltransferase
MSRASLPNKITILRLSAIGDVLMLLPAVRLLKRQFPDTQIDWLIDRPIASLISEVSEVNVVAIVLLARYVTLTLSFSITPLPSLIAAL